MGFEHESQPMVSNASSIQMEGTCNGPSPVAPAAAPRPCYFQRRCGGYRGMHHGPKMPRHFKRACCCFLVLILLNLMIAMHISSQVNNINDYLMDPENQVYPNGETDMYGPNHIPPYESQDPHSQPPLADLLAKFCPTFCSSFCVDNDADVLCNDNCVTQCMALVPQVDYQSETYETFSETLTYAEEAEEDAPPPTNGRLGGPFHRLLKLMKH